MTTHTTGRLSTAIFVLALAHAGTCAARDTETRDLSGFHSVKVGGGVNLVVQQGSDYQVTVATSGGELEDLHTEVKQDVLVISRDPSSSFFTRFLMQGLRAFISGDKQFTVTIVSPALNDIIASGGSNVRIPAEFTGDSLSIRASGGSDVSFNGKVKQLSITNSGGSDVTLRGSAEHIDLDISGGSDVLGLREFEASDAVITASGGSDVTIRATHSLKIAASGGSDVVYAGKPEITDFKNSGGSSIHRR